MCLFVNLECKIFSQNMLRLSIFQNLFATAKYVAFKNQSILKMICKSKVHFCNQDTNMFKVYVYFYLKYQPYY